VTVSPNSFSPGILRRPETESTPFDSILFDSPVLLAGRFRASVGDPRFPDTGPIWNHIFVFPRTAVEIRPAGAEAFVADPNVVVFYNRGQLYTRVAISEDGDRCEWFAFRDAVVLEAVGLFNGAAAGRPDRPFPFRFGPTDPEAYWRQRRIAESLAAGRPEDPLCVEEEMLGIFVKLLAAAFETRPPEGSARQKRRRRDLVEAARRLLARRFREPLTLTEMAGVLGVSPFHLSRVFHEGTGSTLHAYRNSLRLAAALEAVRDPRVDLTTVALDLGYSSHSHFTSAFRRRFGLPPSEARQLLRT
jgi:AraC family transcriptional regulator